MDFKKQLVQRIKETAATIPNLESLTIVGSHNDPNKELEKTNDFDVLVIVKKLDAKSFSVLKNTMNKLASETTTPTIKVWAEYRIGPVKATYDTSEEKGVMLHMLLFDPETFADYNKAAPFITLDWLKFEALYGQNLSESYKFTLPSRDQLLHAPRHSFDFYEKMLNDKVYILLDIEEVGDELKYNSHTYPYPKEQWGELYSDILKKIILNTVIVYSQINKSWSDDELLDRFGEIFPSLQTKKETIKEIIKLKKRIRAGENVSDQIEKYEIDLRDLIAKIKAQIGN